MDKTGFNRIKASGITTLAAMMMLVMISCSKNIPFMVSSVVPSAEGSVKIKNDDNNNYTIELDVIRLADPQRLTPPKLGYMVWMETQGSGVKNIGNLKTSSGTFSKNMKSSLSTVTAFKPVSIFITAEDNLQSSYPGTKVLDTGTFSVK